MKSIILCAGYATRLYPLTLNTPKALLEIAGRPIISYAIDRIKNIGDVDKIYVVTNDKFYNHFVDWNRQCGDEKIKVLNDNTTSNENKLGGIGDLWFVIEKEKIDDDVLVVLGDNIFDFELTSMVDFFKKVQDTVLGVYEIKDKAKLEELGVVEVEGRRIVAFHEKPKNSHLNLASTGFYIFSKADIVRIRDYMKTGKPKEGPGFLIKDWLSSKEIYAHVFEGQWFDIGTKEVYDEVNHLFNER
jgi:glucose-1-phosphate thymidylyltransferase